MGRPTAEQIVYRLGYQATGWITTGDALLANTAAAMARAPNTRRLDALADELTAARAVQPLAA